MFGPDGMPWLLALLLLAFALGLLSNLPSHLRAAGAREM
jgi:hypothetical protein